MMTIEEDEQGLNVCNTLYSFTLPRGITLSLSNICIDQPMQESQVCTGKISIAFLVNIEGSSVIIPSVIMPNGLSIKKGFTLFSYIPNYISIHSETKAQARLLHIEISPNDFIELFGDDLLCSKKIKDNKLIYCALETDNKQLPSLNHIIKIMLKCAVNRHFSKIDRMAVEAYLLSYLIDVIKKTNKYLSSRSKKSTSYQAQMISKQIKEKVMADLSKPPSLIEIAQEVNISVSTLQKYCKMELGTTLFNFFQKERMRYAYDCIYRKKMSVTATAIEVGYSNFSHFSAAFYKQFGLNPSKVKN